MIEELKQRVYRVLNPREEDRGYVDTFIILLIAANVLAVILETEVELATGYAKSFQRFEYFSSIFFTAEYLLRLWTCTCDPRYERPIRGRVRYALSIMALVDLVAILPFFLPAFTTMDLRVARAIRMFRLVRLLKMGRYAYAVRTMAAVFTRKKEELAMTTFILVLLLVFCSSAIYFVEHTAQPENFSSIPAAMWWCIVTLTSVGYGDVVPITTGGRLVGSVIALLGVCFVALPTGIISAGFLEQMREKQRGRDHEVFGFCPHCGEQLMPEEILD